MSREHKYPNALAHDKSIILGSLGRRLCVVYMKNATQNPLQGWILTPSCEKDISTHPSAVSPLKDCSSCRELTCLRACPSQGSPHSMTDHGKDIKAQSMGLKVESF